MKSILISGASIAGPTLAYWLNRYGFDVTVVERAAAPREGGYAVDVRGKAIEVLAQMGVLADVRRKNCDTLGTSFVDARGKRVANMPRGFGVIDEADVEVMRGDLVRVLYDATRRDVSYVFGDAIAALEQQEDGVSVTFERSERRRFDLVIGADGLHSNVRRLVFGDETPFMHHLGSYMAIFTADNHLALDRWQLVQNTPGRVVSIKSVEGNHEVKVATFFSSPRLTYDYRDLDAQRQLTAAAFADAGWAMPHLLDVMKHAPDFYFDSTSQVRMPQWSRERVTLVGDASSCPSPLAGQGSSMAIVSAYVLAGELAAAAGDHRVGYARYEQGMRAFTQRNQQISSKLADGFAPKTRFAIWARNVSLGMLRYVPWTSLIIKLAMRDIVTAANAIELRDYRSFEPTRKRAAVAAVAGVPV
jgi:2-polyprenyl-6-methoxyphenol hydroxylase-like FAD-dependent oxidoreductase